MDASITNPALEMLRGKKVLLLQGPVGPFFLHFSGHLKQMGCTVHKVNFNAGDEYFYPRDSITFCGQMKDWPAFLGARLRRLEIEAVVMFGDCRPIHTQAIAVAREVGCAVAVFEEGYVRPRYVTFERDGVNAHSTLSRNPQDYFSEDLPELPAPRDLRSHYWPMALHCLRYYTKAVLGQNRFPHYRHHRPLSAREALPWVRSAVRKLRYAITDRLFEQPRLRQSEGHYFLAPLQVFNDSQVRHHSPFASIEAYIDHVLFSFARFAPKDTLLVFKHHPMDRGYTDYTRTIASLAFFYGVRDRVRYVHDLALPELIEGARGVVVINSTTGLSALHHSTPLKVCGDAFYDIPGLTFQGDLDDFWQAAPLFVPDRALYLRFRARMIQQTQLNTSFYLR